MAAVANLKKMGITNVELIPGNVMTSTKEYAKKNVGFRISLLYIDVDNYEGSLAILKNFLLLLPQHLLRRCVWRRVGLQRPPANRSKRQ